MDRVGLQYIKRKVENFSISVIKIQEIYLECTNSFSKQNCFWMEACGNIFNKFEGLCFLGFCETFNLIADGRSKISVLLVKEVT